jgi:heterodisulfide reductase subunit C
MTDKQKVTNTQRTLSQLVRADIRFEESLKACMSCGVCTAICPAASFYDYDPRQVCMAVQENDDKLLLQLLESDTIWECGQCMSCKTRCPRGNVPGMLIQVLRKVSQQQGLFLKSEKGTLQRDIVNNIGKNIYQTGYCVTPDLLVPINHPEQGPIWEWIFDNRKEVFDTVGAAYQQEKAGAVRKLTTDTMSELHQIMKETGCDQQFINILGEKPEWME